MRERPMNQNQYKRDNEISGIKRDTVFLVCLGKCSCVFVKVKRTRCMRQSKRNQLFVKE